MKSALIFLPKCHAELPNRAILTELNIGRDEELVLHIIIYQSIKQKDTLSETTLTTVYN